MKQISKANFSFVCPDCKKSVNFREAFTEERIENTDVDQISVVCPYCDSTEVSYYSNTKIRNNIKKLRRIRDSEIPNKIEKYAELRGKHQKYFDKFNKTAKEKYGGVVNFTL